MNFSTDIKIKKRGLYLTASKQLYAVVEKAKSKKAEEMELAYFLKSCWLPPMIAHFYLSFRKLRKKQGFHLSDLNDRSRIIGS